MKLSVIIPVYNEKNTVHKIIRQVPGYLIHTLERLGQVAAHPYRLSLGIINY